MRITYVAIAGALVVGACVAQKEYMKDWMAPTSNASSQHVVTVPVYPEAGRKFRIHRTYQTERASRQNRWTPAEGYEEILEVSDDQGTLKFWREKELIHTIKLGPCLSFARMDENHDFAVQGSPAYFTAPKDCKLWNGREWHQTYRTLVVGWVNPCVYEAKRKANLVRSKDDQIIRVMTDIQMTMEKNGRTYDWSNSVEYDPELKFFRMFDIGYIGRVKVLEELKGAGA